MKSSSKKAMGAGIVALAAAATAAYFMSNKKNRNKVSAWAQKAKKEVVKELKNAGSVSQSAYNEAVDIAMQNYKNLKNIDRSEVLALAKELKGHWQNIQKTLKKHSKTKVG